MQSTVIVQSLGFTNNKTDKILEFKNRGIKAAAGTVQISPCDLHGAPFSLILNKSVNSKI